jgi:hypothetical protein
MVLQSVTQSFENYINLTYLPHKEQVSPPGPSPKQARSSNLQMLRNQEGPSAKNVFRDIKYEQIQALAPSMQVWGTGNNPGAKFRAAWAQLWDNCKDKAHYERLAALDKRYVSLCLFSSHVLTLVQ